MVRLYPTRRDRSRIQLLERARDLGVDIERLEALTAAAFVAGDNQLGPPLGQPRVLRGSGLPLGIEQARDLRVYVQCRLAPAHPSFAARLQHLANFPLAFGADRRRVGTRRSFWAQLASGVIGVWREA